MRKKEPKFKPRSASEAEVVDDILELSSDDEIKDAAEFAQNELVKQDKKSSKISKISAIWTIISTIYAIVTTGIFIGRGWVSQIAAIVLLCILGVYICVFIVLVVVTFKDAKGGATQVKMYKKTLGIFKAIANVVLLSFTAVSMVGMSLEGVDGVLKLIMFIVTFAVGVVQLGLKITLFVMKLIRIQIAKKFKVEFYKFVDGKRKKKSLALKIEESRYKQK